MTGVQTCALPIYSAAGRFSRRNEYTLRSGRAGRRPGSGMSDDMSFCRITFICSAHRRGRMRKTLPAGSPIGSGRSVQGCLSYPRSGSATAGIRSCAGMKATVKNGRMCSITLSAPDLRIVLTAGLSRARFIPCGGKWRARGSRADAWRGASPGDRDSGPLSLQIGKRMWRPAARGPGYAKTEFIKQNTAIRAAGRAVLRRKIIAYFT